MSSATEPSREPHFKGKPRVIVTRKLMPAVETRLSELFDAELNSEDMPLNRDALVAAMNAADVLVPTVTDRIDASMFAEAGDRLKLIANFGAGTEHLDLAAARAHKIVVTNTPGVFTDDTADLTLMLILSVPRRIGEGSRLVRDGKWTGWAPSAMLGHRIGGRRLGIVGMGRIGQAVAHRAKAFGMEVTYHNRHRLPDSLENMLGVSYEAELDKLISEADVLTLHCPAGAATHHLLGPARLAAMKPGSFVINTARDTGTR